MEKTIKHWSILLEEVKVLRSQDNQEDAYAILRSIYESNTFRYDKAVHANYEHYIEEKVKFFIELAQVSMLVTEDAAKSIPYIDEALILIDGSESVHPYVDVEQIKQLKRDYISLAKKI